MRSKKLKIGRMRLKIRRKRLVTRRKVNEALKNLKQIITLDTINNALENNYKQSRDLWYQQSYSLILERFALPSNKFEKPMNQWIERKAWVGSWLPTILKGEINETDIMNLSKLESKYRNFEIINLNMDEISMKEWEEIIFKFLQVSNKILYGDANWHKTVASTSKLLHFMCPHLFPIMDKVVLEEIISARSSYNMYKNYVDYFAALFQFLEDDQPLKKHLMKISSQRKESVLRIIDLVIFSRRTTKN